MLSFVLLYANGNISFGRPHSMYIEYRDNRDIDNIIKKYKNDKSRNEVVVLTKNEMIKDIMDSPKLTNLEKRKIVLGIRYVKIIVADLSYGDNPYLKQLIGLYQRKNKQYKSNYILVDNKLSDSSIRWTILHELTHLKDDMLVDGDELYSSTHNLNIVDYELTTKKVYDKVDDLFNMYMGGEANKKALLFEDQKNITNLREYIVKYITTNIEYKTHNSEVYVRLWIMRKYLLENGQIETLHQDISKDNIAFLLSFGHLLTSEPTQFMELLFLMRLDINGDSIDVHCLDELNKIP